MSEHQRKNLPSHEELAQLARENPQAFETLRREVIDSFIESVPARMEQRLRGLQFRVDCERSLSHSALGSTVKIYALMWDSFLRLNDGWQELMRAEAECLSAGQVSIPTVQSDPNETARILEYRPRVPHDPQ